MEGMAAGTAGLRETTHSRELEVFAVFNPKIKMMAH